MKTLSVLFVFLLICSVLLGPVEAGLLAWLAEKFWFLNPWRLLTGRKTESSSGTTGSFNNNGNKFQNLNGVTINSGLNAGDGRITFKINNNNKQNGNNFNGVISFGDGTYFGGDGDNYSYMWTGPVYQLKRRFYEENKQCIEDIVVYWKGVETGVQFKPKCLANLIFRKTLNYNALLLVGKPDEDFLVFSSKKSEYYYKENGKWKKGNVKGDKLEESEISSTEVKKLENRIKKWGEVVEKNNNEIKKIGDQQRKESDEYTAEINKISNAMNDEGDKLNRNAQQIELLRNNEYKRQEEDQRIYNQMLATQGWNANVNAKLQENLRKQEEGNNRLNAKYDEEYETYQREYNKLLEKMNDLTEKYNKITTPKFQNMYDQEGARFLKEYNNLIANGY